MANRRTVDPRCGIVITVGTNHVHGPIHKSSRASIVGSVQDHLVVQTKDMSYHPGVFLHRDTTKELT